MDTVTAPPSLVSDTAEPSQTNTHALILPHQSLFLPPILDRLKVHYEQYGNIAHWAPIRGFGRVIIVYEDIEGADRAKRQGDWLKLDVDLPAEENHDPTADTRGGSAANGTSLDGLPEDGSGSMDIDEPAVRGENSFKRHRQRKSKGPVKG